MKTDVTAAQCVLSEKLMKEQAKSITAQVETIHANIQSKLAENFQVETNQGAHSELADNITTQLETVRSDLVIQSEVVKQLQNDVRSLMAALHKQTEMIMEQRRQTEESW